MSRNFPFRPNESSAGHSLLLHKHQAEAISLAAAGEIYVLTTGTALGKSLAYLIPIVDACIKVKAIDPTLGTRTIMVYPINALANSHRKTLIVAICAYSCVGHEPIFILDSVKTMLGYGQAIHRPQMGHKMLNFCE